LFILQPIHHIHLHLMSSLIKNVEVPWAGHLNINNLLKDLEA